MGNKIPKEYENIKSLRNKPDAYFYTGRKVRLIANEGYVKFVQVHKHGWQESMKQYLNKEYEVKDIDIDDGIKLKIPEDWIFSKASLEAIENDDVESNLSTDNNSTINHQINRNSVQKKEKKLFDYKISILSSLGNPGKLNNITAVLEEFPFKVGDIVRLSSNEAKFIELQDQVGGYSKHIMRRLLGKPAKIMHISKLGVQVICVGYEFDIHPELIEKVNPLQISSFPKKSTNDFEIKDKEISRSASERSFGDLITENPVKSNDGHKEHSSRGIVNESPEEKQAQLELFFKAIKEGDLESMLRLLRNEWLDIKGSIGRTPINVACCRGQIDIVKSLLEYGVRMDIFDDKGKLPVHNSLLFNHVEILEFLLTYDKKTVQALTSDGQTLLHLAIISDQQDKIKLLKEARINEYIMDNDGKKASDYCRDSYTLPERNESSDSVNKDSHLESLSMSTTLVECDLCNDGKKDTYFRDCGHTSCSVCAEKLVDCHLCRQRITERRRLL